MRKACYGVGCGLRTEPGTRQGSVFVRDRGREWEVRTIFFVFLFRYDFCVCWDVTPRGKL